MRQDRNHEIGEKKAVEITTKKHGSHYTASAILVQVVIVSISGHIDSMLCCRGNVFITFM